MEKEKFETLIKKAECDTLNDLELIGFTSTNDNYSLGFFAEERYNYKVEVEDFGRMFRGKWQQDDPTQEQIDIMQKKINDKVEEIKKLPNEVEEIEEEIIDHYEHYGVKRSDFY